MILLYFLTAFPIYLLSTPELRNRFGLLHLYPIPNCSLPVLLNTRLQQQTLAKPVPFHRSRCHLCIPFPADILPDQSRQPRIPLFVQCLAVHQFLSPQRLSWLDAPAHRSFRLLLLLQQACFQFLQIHCLPSEQSASYPLQVIHRLLMSYLPLAQVHALLFFLTCTHLWLPCLL